MASLDLLLGALKEAGGNALIKGGITSAVLLAISFECDAASAASAACAPASPLPVTLAMVAVLIPFFAVPTNGLYNVAMTTGALVAGDLTLPLAALYVCSQCLGIVGAMTLLRLAAPGWLHAFVRPPSSPLLPLYAGLAELVCTFASVLLALSADEVPERARLPVVVAAVCFLIATSGACMDPSAALAGAYFAGDYALLLEVYVLPALVGAALAGAAKRALAPPTARASYLARHPRLEPALEAALTSAVEADSAVPLEHVVDHLSALVQRNKIVAIGRARSSDSPRASGRSSGASYARRARAE